MDILTTFYIEAYKKGLYSDIPIWRDANGENYYLTDKQIHALRLLQDDVTLFLGYGGSARCCKSGTYVNSSSGYTKIEDIKENDFVLSYDISNSQLNYKRVLHKFEYNVDKELVNINGLTITNDHKVLFRGEWTEVGELRRRIMETNFRAIYGFRYGKNCIYKLFRSWVASFNAPKFKEGIQQIISILRLPNTEKPICPQASSERICSEPSQLRTGESFESHKDRQSFRELGMVHERSEHGICEDSFTESEEIDSRNCFGYAKRLFRRIRDTYDCKEIFEIIFFGKRRYSNGNVEARELTFNEIKNSTIEHYTGKVYDLEVADTHSYCVTKENIVVHNSGKSALECFWVVFQCLGYEGVAYALGRRELSVLRKTVLITLFNLLSMYNLKDGIDYKYHEQKSMLRFSNGSVIFLVDMAYQPSDPLYTRFGGFELTGAAVDESNESDVDAIGTLFSRCGWRKNIDYGIKKKMLETFNPDKSHVYTRYYAPHRDNLESESRKFIPALPSDNPHPAVKEWIEDVIKEGDKNRIQRLVYGNFDYDENPDALCDYDAICDVFANDKVENKGVRRISADLAMAGRDRFVAGLWRGLVCTIPIDKVKATGKSIENDLKALIRNHGVYNSNVVSDADGLGNYLSSYIKNIKTFRGNHRPVNRKDFGNLKDECGYKLAEMINKREIRIICTPKQEEHIKQELSVCLRRDNMDADTQKKKIISKVQAKKELNGSPDYYDMLMMNMSFYLKLKTKGFKVRVS
jgi:hypothetical protein